MVDVIRHEYESVTQMLKAFDGNDIDNLPVREKVSDDFAYGSFDDAMKLARDGWETDRLALETMLDEMKSVLAETMELGFTEQYDVSGGWVDIDRYISGDPECMITQVPVPTMRQGNVCKIVVDAGFPWFVNNDSVLRRGAATLALIEILRLMGHNAELWTVDYSTGNRYNTNKAMAITVKIKDTDDQIDINQIAFALMHPSYLRRIHCGLQDVYSVPGFRHTESYALKKPIPQSAKDEFNADLFVNQVDNDVKYDVAWVKDQLRKLGVWQED